MKKISKIHLIILLTIGYLSTNPLLAHNQADLNLAYASKGDKYKPRTKHLIAGKAKFTNHLILSNSPYLLQHAHNPVKWYGFDDEAFNLAKKQNKLIFLSIGYATCHWCHVMEEESFEYLEVAKILNQNFIAIKVDREVLPDVDSHFMNIAVALNGTGGWPLNVVLDSDGNLFFAGTYFPKKALMANLNNLQNLWQTNKPKIKKQVLTIKQYFAQQKSNISPLKNNLPQLAITNLLQNFDEFYGGFGNAPKFPHEAQLLLLITQQLQNPSNQQLKSLTTTLDNMASGGIFDVIGGGFHRYSTDNQWLVPHFEKMLYNQAQLGLVYLQAYQLTNKLLYKKIALQTLDYTIKEMQDKNGGFYSATDADSDGAEGRFFIWTLKEIANILQKDFVVFKKYFDTSEATLFENSNKHIIRYKDISSLNSSDFKIITPLLTKLYQARFKRKKPLLDHKILLSWNALLLKTLVLAGDIDKKYTKIAQNLADFLIQTFIKQDKLFRVKIDNNISQLAIFTDYSSFIDALATIFIYTGDKKYLDLAIKLTDKAIVKFWDTKNYGFFASNNQIINITNKDIYDGAIFSSNGIMYHNLIKIFDLTGDIKYKKYAKQLLSAFASKINKAPQSYPSIINTQTPKALYTYAGKIKITSKNNLLTINIAKGWHINANKTLQKGIIATTLIGENIVNIQYPKAKFINLGWNDAKNGKLAVYTGNVEIKYQVKNNKNTTQGILKIQACSDAVCLPPKNIKIWL